MAGDQIMDRKNERIITYSSLSYRDRTILIGTMTGVMFFIIVVTALWVGPALSRLMSTPGFVGYFLIGIFETLATIAFSFLSTSETRKFLKAFADVIWNSFATLTASVTLSNAMFIPVPKAAKPTPSLSTILSGLMNYPHLFAILVTGLMFAAATKCALSAHELLTSSPKTFLHVVVPMKRE